MDNGVKSSIDLSSLTSSTIKQPKTSTLKLLNFLVKNLSTELKFCTEDFKKKFLH